MTKFWKVHCRLRLRSRPPATPVARPSIVFGIVGTGLGLTGAGRLSDLYAVSTFGANYMMLCIENAAATVVL